MTEVVFLIPFIAIIAVLLIIVVAFEVRKRKIRSLMRKGYTFVVNPYGRIVTMIPPGDNYSDFHQRQQPQSFPPQPQPMGFYQPAPYPQQPTSLSDQQLPPYPPQSMPFPQQPTSFSDQQPPYPQQSMPLPYNQNQSPRY